MRRQASRTLVPGGAWQTAPSVMISRTARCRIAAPLRPLCARQCFWSPWETGCPNNERGATGEYSTPTGGYAVRRIADRFASGPDGVAGARQGRVSAGERVVQILDQIGRVFQTDREP